MIDTDYWFRRGVSDEARGRHGLFRNIRGSFFCEIPTDCDWSAKGRTGFCR